MLNKNMLVCAYKESAKEIKRLSNLYDQSETADNSYITERVSEIKKELKEAFTIYGYDENDLQQVLVRNRQFTEFQKELKHYAKFSYNKIAKKAFKALAEAEATAEVDSNIIYSMNDEQIQHMIDYLNDLLYKALYSYYIAK